VFALVGEGDGIVWVRKEGWVKSGVGDQRIRINAHLPEQCRHHEQWRHAHGTLLDKGQTGQGTASSGG